MKILTAALIATLLLVSSYAYTISHSGSFRITLTVKPKKIVIVRGLPYEIVGWPEEYNLEVQDKYLMVVAK